MIKAAIYDMDNLLVNSIPLYYRSWNIALAPYGKNIFDLPQAVLSSFVGKRASDIVDEIISYWKLESSPEKLKKERRSGFLRLINKELELLPGALKSLEFFKRHKIKLALASSADREYIDIVLLKFNLRFFFESVVASGDVLRGKPDPEIFSKSAKNLKLKPGDCVVLEDAQNGVLAAKKAGCWCIAVLNEHTPPQNLNQADLVLNSLEDLNLHNINRLI